MNRIQAIQGTNDWSPFSGKAVTTQGVVTNHARNGFVIQDPTPDDSGASPAIFVRSQKRPQIGNRVEVSGTVEDFQKKETDHPMTQIRASTIKRSGKTKSPIAPTWITRDVLEMSEAEQKEWLRAHESVLLGFAEGSRFIGRSNPFADYVLVPPDALDLLNPYGAFVQDESRPRLWIPGFKLRNRDAAPAVNVGAALLGTVVGHLGFRAGGYQIQARDSQIEVKDVEVHAPVATILPTETQLSVLTLNTFNLDPHHERAHLVNDPDRDIDDDQGDGRFEALGAAAIVAQAGTPDIIALQEIQGNNGAELARGGPEETAAQDLDASDTLAAINEWVEQAPGGVRYEFGDVAPTELGRNGGQPNAEIRNAFFWNPERVELTEPLAVLGLEHEAYEGTRKPLVGKFRFKNTDETLTVINIHAASKRHEVSPFAPTTDSEGRPVPQELMPGYDEVLTKRIAQAEVVSEYLSELEARGERYFLTGDANAHAFSPSMRALCGEDRVNLVETLPPEEQFDYNHRGISQILTNGVVFAADAGSARYEILHGYAGQGSKPGQFGDMTTDHDLTLAGFDMAEKA